MILRDFLYLDRAIVRDFLAQIEGGVVDEATERSTTSGKGGFGAKVGAGPVALSGDKSRETSLQTEAVIRQVAASEFDRLYTHLEAEDLVVLDEVSDADVLTQIRRKQFLEVDARVQVSGVRQMMSLMASFGELAPLMEQFGTDVDAEALAGMKALAGLAGADKAVPMIATVPGGAHLKIALELDPAFVLTDNWDLDASVLLKVQRVIKGNEKYVVGDPFGGLMQMMPEADRDKFTTSLKSPELVKLGIGDSEITAPALVGTPIAIYR